jgi:ubiquinone/menaquinone biosynthesis C-methylase UbiE
MTDRIHVFDSGGDAYKRAFEVFLRNTDQKKRARAWFERFLGNLGKQQVLIDAGAGSGEVTAWLSPWFAKTIAVEPNPYLLARLQQLLPSAEAICQPILNALPSEQADLVVCSHTFYYIPRPAWLAHAERLLSWMKPTGTAVIIVQHHDTDCMRMLEHFCGHRFNLSVVAELLHAQHGNRFTTSIVRDDAYVETQDFQSACTIAEFMLNLLPLANPPTRTALLQYIRSHFTPVKDGYRFSCHQDFLTIRAG